MPKKLNVSPNQRIDIPDFIRAANDYSAEAQNFYTERFLINGKPHVLDGFRIELADQATYPGEITVHNGNAFTRNGQHVNEESDVVSNIPVTLQGTGTFYVEIEFLEEEDDPDSRAFWDPTVPNTAPIPSGEEFEQSTNTRLTPTWRIVQPVSITGFSLDSDPNSSRIPLVCLVTNGSGEITAGLNTGFVLEKPYSTLIEDAAIGATTLKIATAQLFSADAAAADNTVTIDPSDVSGLGSLTRTVSSIDLANNVLTVAALTAVGPYPAGTRIDATGKPQLFLMRRATGAPDLTGTNTHPDRTSRFFQGNETKGAAYLGGLVAADSVELGVRTDLEIKSLKTYVDALASQLLELKTGSSKLGVTVAPPLSFDVANTPYHWFDRAPGVLGSRTASVTIGDGISSFGDFNGTDETVFQAAVNAVEANAQGGVVFVKRGSYTFANPVSITRDVRIVGEGQFATSIVNTGISAAGFLLTSATGLGVGFYNMALTGNATVPHFAEILGPCSYLEVIGCLCTLAGVTSDASGFITRATLSDCIFVDSSFDNNGSVHHLVYTNNRVAFSTTGKTAIDLTDLTGQATVHNNHVSLAVSDSTSTFLFITNAASASAVSSIAVKNNHISVNNTPASLRMIYSPSNTILGNITVDGLYLNGSLLNTLHFIDINYCRSLVINNVSADDPFNASGFAFLNFHRANTSPTLSNTMQVSLSNIHLRADNATTYFVRGISSVTGEKDIRISNCSMKGFANPINYNGYGTLSVENCLIDGLIGGNYQSLYGLTIDSPAATTLELSVKNSKFVNIGVTGVSAYGISIEAIGRVNAQISGCLFDTMGDTTADTVAGIYNAGAEYDNFTVRDCSFIDISAAAVFSRAIYVGISDTVTGQTGRVSILNNQVKGLGTGVAAGNVVGISVASSFIVTNVLIDGNTLANCNGTNVKAIEVLSSGNLVSNTIISNNTIRDTIASEDTIGEIEIIAPSILNVRVCGNDCNIASLSGAPGTFNGYAILLTANIASGSFSNVSISDNVITGSLTSSYTYGIGVNGTTSGVAGLTIANNSILLGSNAGSEVSSFIRLTGMGTNGNPFVVGGVNIKGNSLTENTFRALRTGIHVVGAPKLLNLVIADNVISGKDGIRAGTFGQGEAMYIWAVDKFTCTGNVVDWTDALTGVSPVSDLADDLHFRDCHHGMVTGNTVLRRGGPTGRSAIGFNSECRVIFCALNIVGGAIAALEGNISGHDTANRVIALTGTAVEMAGVTAGADMNKLNMDYN
jgi:hypothetical protein